MSKPTTMPNGTKLERLTTRQQLDAREMSMRFGMRLMTQMACFALGFKEDPDTGKKIQPMTSQQLKAAEIILKKILPDQAAVQMIQKDDFEHMSRGEMLELLSSVVAGNPQLIEHEEIRRAVNESQTVIDIHRKKDA